MNQLDHLAVLKHAVGEIVKGWNGMRVVNANLTLLTDDEIRLARTNSLDSKC